MRYILLIHAVTVATGPTSHQYNGDDHIANWWAPCVRMSRQPEPAVSPSLEAGTVTLPDWSLEDLDMRTPRLTDELSSPRRTHSSRLSSPLFALPSYLLTRNLFADHWTGSPWSQFQRSISVFFPSVSSQDAGSQLPFHISDELSSDDVQSTLLQSIHSVLSSTSNGTTERNLDSTFKQFLPTCFPGDQSPNSELLPAPSDNTFLGRLVLTTFGMAANEVLSEEEMQWLLNMLKRHAPKTLLNHLLTGEDSTARASVDNLLKHIATQGDENSLDFLLNIGVSEQRLSGIEGGELLRCAVDSGNIAMAKRLVQAGADPNYEPDYGEPTPLCFAVDSMNVHLTKLCLAAGAEVDRPSYESEITPLSKAVEQNMIDCVSLLLESGAAVEKSQIQDEQGWVEPMLGGLELPVLDYAYLMGYTETYQLLLSQSKGAGNHLIISGIIQAARLGLQQLHAYLESQADDDGRQQRTMLEKALSFAVRHNTEDEAIDVLLDLGVNPNTPSLSGRADYLPLSQAIPDFNLVYRLIDAGAEINKAGVILGAARDDDNIDCLSYLITSGLNLQALGSIGLGSAIKSQAMASLKLLLAAGAPVDGRDMHGLPPILAAIEFNPNLETLRLLLLHGADVNAPGRDGARPIHQAIARRNVEMVKALVGNGALLDLSGLKWARYGTVLEEWATCFGDDMPHEYENAKYELFNYLLENGAPVNASQDYQGPASRNSLLTTLINNFAEDYFIYQVLNKGARVNEAKLSFPGWPVFTPPRAPIQAAAEKGRLNLVKELHRRGADLNASPGFRLGRTALQAACGAQKGSLEVVTYLLDHGAEVNAKPCFNGGVTAIQAAAIQGNIKVVSLLLEWEADLNAGPSPVNGRTALDGAAEYGRLDMVYMLLKAGAKCERQGVSGYDSAIEFARKGRHWEVAKLLERHGKGKGKED